MKKVFIVHGLKRSGNHAVINWICSHSSFIFFNDVVNINPVLQGNAPPEPFEDLPAFLAFKFPNRFKRALLCCGRTPLLSLEDQPLDTRPISKREGLAVTNILVLRDPHNLFASRIRKAQTVDYPCYSTEDFAIQRAIELWKAHAREFISLTETLENKICIYYNAWFSREAYRRSISRQLHFKFTDNGLNKVPRTGGGSSFDKKQFNGKASQMNVLHRAQQLNDKEKSLLERITRDRELQELAEQVENTVSGQLQE